LLIALPPPAQLIAAYAGQARAAASLHFSPSEISTGAFGFAPRNRPEKLFTRRVMNWLDERVLIRYDEPLAQLPASRLWLGSGA
jgi:hypothetical protein